MAGGEIFVFSVSRAPNHNVGHDFFSLDLNVIGPNKDVILAHPPNQKERIMCAYVESPLVIMQEM